jgi:hypothetical protein
LKNTTRFENPHIVYKKNQNIARNLKQVQNLKTLINRNERIGYDEILNVHIMHRQTKFIKAITTIPDLLITAYDPVLLEEINKMLKVYNGKVLFSYDTTFNLGDFYLSVLLCQHALLKNDPMIPIMYLFHDRKLESEHAHFFQIVKDVKRTFY